MKPEFFPQRHGFYFQPVSLIRKRPVILTSLFSLYNLFQLPPITSCHKFYFIFRLSRIITIIFICFFFSNLQTLISLSLKSNTFYHQITHINTLIDHHNLKSTISHLLPPSRSFFPSPTHLSHFPPSTQPKLYPLSACNITAHVFIGFHQAVSPPRLHSMPPCFITIIGSSTTTTDLKLTIFVQRLIDHYHHQIDHLGFIAPHLTFHRSFYSLFSHEHTIRLFLLFIQYVTFLCLFRTYVMVKVIFFSSFDQREFCEFLEYCATSCLDLHV